MCQNSNAHIGGIVWSIHPGSSGYMICQLHTRTEHTSRHRPPFVCLTYKLFKSYQMIWDSTPESSLPCLWPHTISVITAWVIVEAFGDYNHISLVVDAWFCCWKVVTYNIVAKLELYILLGYHAYYPVGVKYWHLEYVRVWEWIFILFYPVRFYLYESCRIQRLYARLSTICEPVQ